MVAIIIAGFFVFFQTTLFVVGYIQTSNLFQEALSPEEEKEYLKKMSTGDEDARNILIERNLRLVAHVCKKYNIPNVDNEDLISLGTIGLIKGINTFKMDKDVKLSTYVARCIENEILMYLRNVKKLVLETSLNDSIGKDKDDNEITVQDVIEAEGKNIEDEIDLRFKTKKLYNVISKMLKGREKEIVTLRFGLYGKKPQTQKQVAKLIGISRSYVSRIESKAIGKLKQEMVIEM
jgi:RNA polymerase sporulation-specific sigma factor